MRMFLAAKGRDIRYRGPLSYCGLRIQPLMLLSMQLMLLPTAS